MAHRPSGLVRAPRRVRCRTLRLDRDQRRIHRHVIFREVSPTASALSSSPREQTTPSSSTPLTESRAILGTVHQLPAEGSARWPCAEPKWVPQTPEARPPHNTLAPTLPGCRHTLRSSSARAVRRDFGARLSVVPGDRATSHERSGAMRVQFSSLRSDLSSLPVMPVTTLSPGPDPRRVHCSNVRFTVSRNPAATL
jgi:hypothetical protein